MDPPLLRQLQLSSDYQIVSDHDCVAPIASHDHNSPFANDRETLGTSSILSLPQGTSTKVLTSRHATDSSYPGASPNLQDSGSSTGSASSSSSIAFSFPQSTSLYSQAGSSSNLPGPFLSASPVFGASYFASSSFSPLGALSNTRPLSSVDASGPAILHSIRAPNPTPPTSHTASSGFRDSYTTSTPGLHRHLGSRTHLDMSRPFPDPRPISTQPSNMSYPSTPAFGARQSQESPPFEGQETFVELKQEDGSPISVGIDCRIEKGFFMSTSECWTCYRRNYFSVNCSYTLTPLPYGKSVFLERQGKSSKFEQIQAMAVCLGAVVDGHAGKTVDLVQHTPKRDRGPQTSVQKIKIMPKSTLDGKLPSHSAHDMSTYPMQFGYPHQHQLALPNFPLQQSPDSGTEQLEDVSSGSSTFQGNSTSPTAYMHTFERIQFKSATANNGKRRAQQQYYHLIVELWADVRAPTSNRPDWVKVAQRVSSQVVVRGRSPSHYSNEGPNSTTRTVPSGTLGTSHSSLPTRYPWEQPTSASSSGYQSTLPRYSTGPSSTLPYMSSQHHHQHHHDDHTSGGSPMIPMSDNSHVDSLRTLPSHGTASGYSYIPTPLYEAGLVSPSAKAMVKQETKMAEDHHAAGSGVLPMSNNCRLVGLDSSRGIYSFGNVGQEHGY